MIPFSRRRFVLRLSVFLGGAALAPDLLAHAKLRRSVPKDGAEVEMAPAKLELWFNELLDDSFNTARVFAAAERGKKDRADYVKGKPKVDRKDRTHLLVELKRLPPGEYIAEYRVLSRDGHSAPGRLTFKVARER